MQAAERRAHAPQARLQDVDAVDALHRADGDGDASRGHDLGVELLANLGREHLGIVDALRDAVGIEDHRRDHHGPGPWPAARLVDAGDRQPVQIHHLRLEVEAGQARRVDDFFGRESHDQGLSRKPRAVWQRSQAWRPESCGKGA